MSVAQIESKAFVVTFSCGHFSRIVTLVVSDSAPRICKRCLDELAAKLPHMRELKREPIPLSESRLALAVAE